MPIIADPTAYLPDQVFNIDLSKIMWRATGSYLGEDAHSRSRLTATLRIGEADHHLDAIQVTEIDGTQCGATGAEEEIADLDMFCGGGDGAFETVSIEGRKYVIFMTPFRT